MKSRKIAFFMIAFTLGGIGWWMQLGYNVFALSDLLDAMYRSIQLFLGNFDLPQAHEDSPVPVTLQIARFMAPLVTIWALFELVGGHVTGLPGAIWAKIVKREEYVILGFGDIGKAIAVGLIEVAKDDRTPRIVVLDRSLDFAETELAKAMSLEGRLSDVRALGKWNCFVAGIFRAEKIFIALGDDDLSLQAAELLISKYGVPADRIWTHIGQYDLLDRLRDIDPKPGDYDAVRPRYFSLYEAAAEKLWVHDAPFTEAQKNGYDRMCVALVGVDKFTRSVVENLALYGIYGAPDFSMPTVIVIDPDAGKFEDQFRSRHPSVQQWLEIRAIEKHGDQIPWMEKSGRLNVTGDDKAVSHWVFADKYRAEALALYRGMSMDARPTAKILVTNEVVDSRSRVAGVAHGRGHMDLAYFGNLKEASSFSIALNEMRERLARAFHFDHTKGKQPHFEDLSESFRMSNWRAALHTVLKLKMLGFANADPRKPALGLMQSDVERLKNRVSKAEGLAELEHLRWCTDRFLDGWTPTEGNDSKGDDQRRTRPQLNFRRGAYNNLDAAEIDKDKKQIAVIVNELSKTARKN